jgi:hypothetical protein
MASNRSAQKLSPLTSIAPFLTGRDPSKTPETFLNHFQAWLTYAINCDATEQELVRGISQAFADGSDDVYLSRAWWECTVQSFKANLSTARAAELKGDQLIAAVWDPLEEDFRKTHASLLPPPFVQLQRHMQALQPGSKTLMWLHKFHQLSKAAKLHASIAANMLLGCLADNGHPALFSHCSTFFARTPDATVEQLLKDLRNNPHVLRASAAPVPAAAAVTVSHLPPAGNLSALVTAVTNSMSQLNANFSRVANLLTTRSSAVGTAYATEAVLQDELDFSG